MTTQEAAANVGKQVRSARPIETPGGRNAPRGTEFDLKEFHEGPSVKFVVRHDSKDFGSFDVQLSSSELHWFMTEREWRAQEHLSAL